MQVQEIQPGLIVRYTRPFNGDTFDAIVEAVHEDGAVDIHYVATTVHDVHIRVQTESLVIPR